MGRLYDSVKGRTEPPDLWTRSIASWSCATPQGIVSIIRGWMSENSVTTAITNALGL